MAIDKCQDNGSPLSSRGVSPRLSFSQEFNQTDGVPIEHYPNPSNLQLESSDFDFCLRPSFDDLEPSSADELFSNGVLLPSKFKKHQQQLQPPQPPLPPSPLQTSFSSSLASLQQKQMIMQNDEGDEKVDQGSSSKSSLWGFKRSRSFNCGSFNGKGLCPLPLLSRSKSTGSENSMAKRSLVSKEDRGYKHIDHNLEHYQRQRKQNLQKGSSNMMSSKVSSRPPLKKSYSGQLSNNGVMVNPVLNMPSANLFGLGSFFSTGKDKGKKK